MSDRDRLLDIPDPLATSEHAPPPMPSLPAVKSPTRAERKRSLTFVIAAAVVYQFAWLALIEHRADLSRSSPTLLMLGVVVPLVLGLGAIVLPEQVTVAAANTAFDENGHLVDKALQNQLKDVVEKLAKAAKVLHADQG